MWVWPSFSWDVYSQVYSVELVDQCVVHLFIPSQKLILQFYYYAEIIHVLQWLMRCILNHVNYERSEDSLVLMIGKPFQNAGVSVC